MFCINSVVLIPRINLNRWTQSDARSYSLSTWLSLFPCRLHSVGLHDAAGGGGGGVGVGGGGRGRECS